MQLNSTNPKGQVGKSLSGTVEKLVLSLEDFDMAHVQQ